MSRCCFRRRIDVAGGGAWDGSRLHCASCCSSAVVAVAREPDFRSQHAKPELGRPLESSRYRHRMRLSVGRVTVISRSSRRRRAPSNEHWPRMWPCLLLDCRLCPYHPGVMVFFDSDPTSGSVPPDAQGDQIYSVPIVGGPAHESLPRLLTPPSAPTVGPWPSWRQTGLVKRPTNRRTVASNSRRWTDPGSPVFGLSIQPGPWSARDSATCPGRADSPDALVRSTGSFERTSRARGCSASRMKRARWLQQRRFRYTRRTHLGRLLR